MKHRRPYWTHRSGKHVSRWMGMLGIIVLSLVSMAGPVRAANGPGLGNLTYTSSELFTRIATIDDTASSGRDGHGNVLMHNGYLATIFTSDGGGSNAGFAFWDVSNPRSPSKTVSHQLSASKIREPHGFGASNSYAGKQLIALQSTDGVQIWDWADIQNPSVVASIVLDGVSADDYADGTWWLHWQAPYIYAAGSQNGLFIVDVSDLANPVVRKNISNSDLGIPRINQVHVIGNLMVINYVQDGSGLALLDVSDPLNPVLKYSTTSSATVPNAYSTMFNGGKIAFAGRDSKMHLFDVDFDSSNLPSGVTRHGLATGTSLGNGGYITFQDNYIHAGMSSKYAKFDISSTTITQVGSIDPNVDSDEDIDFGVVLGNIVFAGNDHGNGTGIIVHQTAPDTDGPDVNFVSPRNNAVSQATTSRVGLSFTDAVDIRTVDSTSFIVRPLGGSALSGKYSHQFNMVNFWPDQALSANTTYEVVVPAGTIKDYAGNTNDSAFTSRFSTGSTIGGGPTGCNIGSNTAGNVNSSISFSVSSCSGSGLTYSWNFGDGSTATSYSSSTTASHTYTAPGHYTVILTAKDSGNQTATFNRTQTVVYPATTNKPTRSSTIIFDSGRSRVSAVNADANTVSSIDSASPFTKRWEVAVGKGPRTLAQPAANGDIWVVNQDDATISVINGGTGASIATINLPYASRPYGIAFNPAGDTAYVTLEATGRLLKINVSDRTIPGNIDIGAKPRGIAVSEDGTRIFVTRFVSPTDNGEVREVRASDFSVIHTFTLAKDTTTVSTEADGPGLPNYVQSITITPDGRGAWVPSKKDNIERGTSSESDGTAMNFETTVRTIVSKLDLINNNESTSNRRDVNNSDLANAVVFNSLGDYAFVSTQGNNHIEVYDALSHNSIGSIDNTGNAPQGLVLNSDSSLLFVQNFMSRDIAIYNVSTVGTSNDFTKQGSNIGTVATETLSAEALAGKKIFYNASATMSKDAYMSCASCHLDGGSDERVWDFTQRGEGMRNTITLLGRAGTYQGPVHWTGNFDEIHDFENDIRGQFEGTGLMTDAQYNAGTRSTALGDRKIGISPDLDQLSIYVSMLNKVPNSPYRNSDGSLTSDAVAGKALFNSPTVGCVSCHSGSQFTDSTLTTPYNRHNVGTITTASGNRNNSTLDGFDTPSLLGVWATAPYLHDGSAATLLDVITTKNSGNNHGTTSQLSSTQKQQLVAYLQQLDQSDYPTITLGTISPTSLSVTAGGSASVTVNVTASDTNTGGSISSVECFRDQTSIGSDTSSPYSVAWTPGSNTAGTYLLQCVATDNDGNKTASEARLLNVGPTAVSITNLSAKDTTNAGDYSVRSNIQIGDTVFGDRTFTFTSLPNSIAGSAWIRTANDSKSATNSPLLTFDIDRQADVYIALDDRLTKPSWLDATWMDTGEELKVREDATNTRTASLYKKNFKSGQVSLGPNGGSNMYVVIVKSTPTTISNLSAKDTTNAADYSIRSNIQNGDIALGDRSFTLDAVPTSIAGSAWIRTANDSKAATNNPLLTFDIHRQANVYIALDDRLTKPSWLDSSWVDTGEELQVKESASVIRTASLYRKNFAAGQVSLGPNGSTNSNMYIVIVR